MENNNFFKKIFIKILLNLLKLIKNIQYTLLLKEIVLLISFTLII